MRLAVQLPEGEDTNEWLAVHSQLSALSSPGEWINSGSFIAVDFFNHLNMLYGTITEFCTPEEVRNVNL